MTSILDQIDRALRAKGLKDATASRLAVGNPSLIKNIRSGAGNVGIETLQKLAQILDLEVYFGPKRELSGVPSIAVAADDFAPIPERSARLAAGVGEINDDDCVIGHLAFRKEWLSRHGILAEKAALVHVRGNSMSPGILDGDLVLIDTRDRDIPVRKPKSQKTLPIFAFVEDGEARVKRIARPSEDQVLILSDNPEFLPEVISGPRLRTLKIIGRVRWWGHTVED